MKTKFAVEKSEYALLLNQLTSGLLTESSILKTIAKMKTLENEVKLQGDELMYIVTTRYTNPLVVGETCAPPMTEKDIKKVKTSK